MLINLLIFVLVLNKAVLSERKRTVLVIGLPGSFKVNQNTITSTARFAC